MRISTIKKENIAQTIPSNSRGTFTNRYILELNDGSRIFTKTHTSSSFCPPITSRHTLENEIIVQEFLAQNNIGDSLYLGFNEIDDIRCVFFREIPHQQNGKNLAERIGSSKFTDAQYSYFEQKKIDPCTKVTTANNRTFSLEQVIDIIDQIASRTEAIHQAGVIHMDISLDNILLLDEKDAQGQIKTKAILGDYSIARKKDQPIKSLFSGSEIIDVNKNKVYGYSPKIHLHNNIYKPNDYESYKIAEPNYDTYCLTNILCILLTNKLIEYWKEKSTTQEELQNTLIEQIQQKRTENSSYNRETYNKLAEIIIRGTSRKDQRYQTAQELFSQLNELNISKPAFSKPNYLLIITDREKTNVSKSKPIPISLNSNLDNTFEKNISPHTEFFGNLKGRTKKYISTSTFKETVIGIIATAMLAAGSFGIYELLNNNSPRLPAKTQEELKINYHKKKQEDSATASLQQQLLALENYSNSLSNTNTNKNRIPDKKIDSDIYPPKTDALAEKIESTINNPKYSHGNKNTDDGQFAKKPISASPSAYSSTSSKRKQPFEKSLSEDKQPVPSPLPQPTPLPLPKLELKISGLDKIPTYGDEVSLKYILTADGTEIKDYHCELNIDEEIVNFGRLKNAYNHLTFTIPIYLRKNEPSKVLNGRTAKIKFTCAHQSSIIEKNIEIKIRPKYTLSPGVEKIIKPQLNIKIGKEYLPLSSGDRCYGCSVIINAQHECNLIDEKFGFNSYHLRNGIYRLDSQEKISGEHDANYNLSIRCKKNNEPVFYDYWHHIRINPHELTAQSSSQIKPLDEIVALSSGETCKQCRIVIDSPEEVNCSTSKKNYGFYLSKKAERVYLIDRNTSGNELGEEHTLTINCEGIGSRAVHFFINPKK